MNYLFTAGQRHCFRWLGYRCRTILRFPHKNRFLCCGNKNLDTKEKKDFKCLIAIRCLISIICMGFNLKSFSSSWRSSTYIL